MRQVLPPVPLPLALAAFLLVASVATAVAISLQTSNAADVWPAGSTDGDGCDSLLDSYRAEAIRRFDEGSPIEFDPGAFVDGGEQEAAEEEESVEGGGGSMEAGASTYAVPPADLGARSESGTNLQEAGIDESDLFKTDGRYIYFFEMGRLLIAESVPEGIDVVAVVDFEDLPQFWTTPEMLLSGDRLLVFGQRGGGPDEYRIRYRGTQIVEIDISRPVQPRILRTIDTRQEFVSARLLGDEVRVVLTTGDRLDFWVSLPGLPRRAVAEESLSYYAPSYVLRDHQSFDMDLGLLTPCSQTAQVRSAPDIRTTTLLRFDVSEGIHRWQSAAVVADAGTVYSTSDSLFVSNDSSDEQFEIHYFDLSDGEGPVFSGRAVLDGELINRFAMSEWDGHLRVATLRREDNRLINALTVHSLEDGLQQVGAVDDIAPGESLRAVRYLGEIGYLLTFPGEREGRQSRRGSPGQFIDPLFLLDLSDHSSPRVTGELDVSGYSVYLHPLGGGRLLGIGPLTRSDTGEQVSQQASLFDVSDMAAPALLDRVVISTSWLPPEFDHRSFSYRDGVATIATGVPRSIFGSDRVRWGMQGELVALRVEHDRLRLQSVRTVPSFALRSIQLEDRIHVLTEREIATFGLPEYELISTVRLHGTWAYRDVERWVTRPPTILPAGGDAACEPIDSKLRQAELRRHQRLAGLSGAETRASEVAASTQLSRFGELSAGGLVAGSNPGLLPESDGLAVPSSVQILGQKAYVLHSGINNIEVFDLADGEIAPRGELYAGSWNNQFVVVDGRIFGLGTDQVSTRALLYDIDISDPDMPGLATELQIDGDAVDAWVRDGQAYVAMLADWRGPPFANARVERIFEQVSLSEVNENDFDSEAVYRYNQHLIMNAPLTSWLPTFTLRVPRLDDDGFVRFEETHGLALPCAAMQDTGKSDTAETFFLLRFDLRHGFDDWDGVGILARSDNSWTTWIGHDRDAAFVPLYDQSNDITTVHEFRLGDSSGISYQGSVQAPGAIVNENGWAIQRDAAWLLTQRSHWDGHNISDAFFTRIRRSAGPPVVAQTQRLRDEHDSDRWRNIRAWNDWAVLPAYCGNCGFELVQLPSRGPARIVGQVKLPGWTEEAWPLGDGWIMVLNRSVWSSESPVSHTARILDVSNPRRPREAAALTDVLPRHDVRERWMSVGAERVVFPSTAQAGSWSRTAVTVLHRAEDGWAPETVSVGSNPDLMYETDAHYYLLSRSLVTIVDKSSLEVLRSGSYP